MTVTNQTTKLAARLEAMERNAAWLGRRLDVTRQMAAGWVNGRDICPPMRRAQILTVLDLPRDGGPYFDGRGFALPEED